MPFAFSQTSLDEGFQKNLAASEPNEENRPEFKTPNPGKRRFKKKKEKERKGGKKDGSFLGPLPEIFGGRFVLAENRRAFPVNLKGGLLTVRRRPEGSRKEIDARDPSLVLESESTFIFPFYSLRGGARP